jgi:hypothetical protein
VAILWKELHSRPFLKGQFRSNRLFYSTMEVPSLEREWEFLTISGRWYLHLNRNTWSVWHSLNSTLITFQCLFLCSKRFPLCLNRQPFSPPWSIAQTDVALSWQTVILHLDF